MNFDLHPRLAADTTEVGDLSLCKVLISKENIGPWLILVPKLPDIKEIHHLSPQQQATLIQESSSVAALLEADTEADKINIGALGNMVPQLHIHHIARFTTDVAWPGPVWGNTEGKRRTEQDQREITEHWQSLLSSVSGFTAA
ncbi:HIT family protein [Veronia nyctiphanis]|uniref:HIT family protein n=1 Tax=Veronia nyctiphanis TaxID=1278244 RepID=A0A4Q0YVC5_9GAMM|nr:HIT family protein [Veronia nyctiphanis]RXJ74755.1 HIT family protein [Veronia nyctiphanis]